MVLRRNKGVNKVGNFSFGKSEFSGFKNAFEHCKTWCSAHQAEVGLAEMALGASIIAMGVHTGQIHFGDALVATKLSDAGMFGGGVGGGLAGIGASLLGSIGVAGSVTFGIPALVLAGGGMLIFGAAGYAAGDIASKLLAPEIGLSDLLAGGSMLIIGTALMIDGARRVVTDERVLALASKFKDGVIELSSLLTEVVARKADEFRDIMFKLAKQDSVTESLSLGAGVVGGAAIGSAAAVGSVTVLGSHALGAAAMALGLVSAPVWPIIAGGAVGVAAGVAAWQGIKKLTADKS